MHGRGFEHINYQRILAQVQSQDNHMDSDSEAEASELDRLVP